MFVGEWMEFSVSGWVTRIKAMGVNLARAAKQSPAAYQDALASAVRLMGEVGALKPAERAAVLRELEKEDSK